VHFTAPDEPLYLFFKVSCPACSAAHAAAGWCPIFKLKTSKQVPYFESCSRPRPIIICLLHAAARGRTHVRCLLPAAPLLAPLSVLHARTSYRIALLNQQHALWTAFLAGRRGKLDCNQSTQTWRSINFIRFGTLITPTCSLARLDFGQKARQLERRGHACAAFPAMWNFLRAL
jgi:hypothetical protein